MARAVLSRLDVYIYKDKVASTDRARVPASGAQLTVYRAGATANMADDLQIAVGAQATIPVFALGAIVAPSQSLHDYVISDGNVGGGTLYVNSTDAVGPSILVTCQGAPVTVKAHGRLTPLNLTPALSARVFANPVGEGSPIVAGPFAADADGRVQVYVGEYKYDYGIWVAGDSAEFRLYADCTGSFVMRA